MAATILSTLRCQFHDMDDDKDVQALTNAKNEDGLNEYPANTEASFASPYYSRTGTTYDPHPSTPVQETRCAETKE